MKSKSKESFDDLVQQHLRLALAEIGPIDPWFDEEVHAWIFEHPLYPESCSGRTREEVLRRYPAYLRQFIEQRLSGNLAPWIEQKTVGRGGRRAGAGRPRGTTNKTRTRTVRLPADLADWIKSDPSHLEKVRKLMLG